MSGYDSLTERSSYASQYNRGRLRNIGRRNDGVGAENHAVDKFSDEDLSFVLGGELNGYCNHGDTAADRQRPFPTDSFERDPDPERAYYLPHRHAEIEGGLPFGGHEVGAIVCLTKVFLESGNGDESSDELGLNSLQSAMLQAVHIRCWWLLTSKPAIMTPRLNKNDQPMAGLYNRNASLTVRLCSTSVASLALSTTTSPSPTA